jgi:2-amino-4-hydroxy-6-hydroxymethyldihydropteridine diphosphokinase
MQALTVAYIGLGSNLCDPVHQITTARAAIERLPAVDEIAFSSLYRSPPMGPADQPSYVNAVMGVRTGLTAAALLAKLQQIEAKQGRVRTGERWGPRTLDLDLLLFDEEQIATPDLTVPHVGIAERAFVLYPLAEIAPKLVIPEKGRLSELLERCPMNGLQRIED